MGERLPVAAAITRRSASGLAVALTVLAVALAASWSAEAKPGPRPAPVTVSVKRSVTGRAVQPGFLGLSIEYWALEAYAGKDAAGLNPVLVQLIRNLYAGQQGSLRIGGVTTDKTWWPVAHLRRPPGVNYTLSRRRLAVIKALAAAVDARLILGINLEADSTAVASGEARAMLRDIGDRNVAAFELGNEPELYGNGNFGWYLRDGQPVPGRAPDYDLAAFTRDFSRMSAALPVAPLAGPSSGAHRWFDRLGEFASHQHKLRVVTVHRYPMQACFNPPASSSYPTISRLLSPAASRGLAASVTPSLTIAHHLHLPLRIDEMNTISCGNPPGVPNTFAMALWALDALFADAQVGVDGVNIHTYPGAVYQLFRFTHRGSQWQGLVEPEYYGLLMFAQAAPPGARLLKTTGTTDLLRVWATRDHAGTTRILVLNDDLARPHVVTLRVAGAHGTGTVERLQAPSAGSTSGITLGGQTYGQSTATGVLTGQRATTLVPATSAGYRVRLPAASAALLTVG